MLPWAYHQGNTTVVWRTNADGSALRQLTSQSFATDPICTPDGKWVYYLERPPGRLMRVPIDGGKAEPVPGSEVPNKFAFGTVDFISGDGNSLALGVYTTDPVTNDARTELETVSLDSSSTTPPQLKALDPRFGPNRMFNPRVQLQARRCGGGLLDSREWCRQPLGTTARRLARPSAHPFHVRS